MQLRMALLAVVANALYYDAALALSHLQSQLGPFFLLWSEVCPSFLPLEPTGIVCQMPHLLVESSAIASPSCPAALCISLKGTKSLQDLADERTFLLEAQKQIAHGIRGHQPKRSNHKL